jgi:hypothetical protein
MWISSLGIKHKIRLELKISLAGMRIKIFPISTKRNKRKYGDKPFFVLFQEGKKKDKSLTYVVIPVRQTTAVLKGISVYAYLKLRAWLWGNIQNFTVDIRLKQTLNEIE